MSELPAPTPMPIPPALTPPEREAPVLVAFSGGLDSTALLHLLAADPAVRSRGLRAVHVDHGLQPVSAAWADHCAEVCAGLGIALERRTAQVDRGSGLGLEAAARQARRAIFAQALAPGECLALAQHRDDQAETFLLRALRASGPDGLAAMRPWRSFGPGWLWRPLLQVPRAALRDYALARGLHWIEDPSNTDTALDRNFLRHRVLPLLHERWPQADAAFARAAALAAEAVDLLDGEDRTLLAEIREETGGGLSATALRALPAARRARLLRHWVADHGWPPLPAEGVTRIERDLLGSNPGHDPGQDRSPAFAWHGVEIRRWRDGLHAVDPHRALPDGWRCEWDGRAPLDLPTGDRLALHGVDGFPSPLLVHARRGGERILLPGREHRHSLKHVLQETDIPPWERARMPLLSTADGEHLLAAGDRIRSAGFEHWLHSAGARVVWQRAQPQQAPS
jgi:tRNA(Ile)-lysidine synthase